MNRPHPHFDDKGTFDWHTDLAEALELARKDGKRLLIGYGRGQCGQCRSLVQSVLPRTEIAESIERGFVLLAADCDSAQAEVEELALKLENATMLPFVLIVDGQGQFIEGFSGVIEPQTLLRALERLSPLEAVPDITPDRTASAAVDADSAAPSSVGTKPQDADRA